MSIAVLNTPLNPAQLLLLRSFERYKCDDVRLEELKDVLMEFYNRKMQEELDGIWKERGYTNDTMHEWLNTHIRTPYK